MSWLGTAVIAAVAIPAAHILAKEPDQVTQLAQAFLLCAPGVAGLALITCQSRVLFGARQAQGRGDRPGGPPAAQAALSVPLVLLATPRLVVPALALAGAVGQLAVAIPMVIVTRRLRGRAAVAGVGYAAAAALRRVPRAPPPGGDPDRAGRRKVRPGRRRRTRRRARGARLRPCGVRARPGRPARRGGPGARLSEPCGSDNGRCVPAGRADPAGGKQRQADGGMADHAAGALPRLSCTTAFFHPVALPGLIAERAGRIAGLVTFEVRSAYWKSSPSTRSTCTRGSARC